MKIHMRWGDVITLELPGGESVSVEVVAPEGDQPWSVVTTPIEEAGE